MRVVRHNCSNQAQKMRWSRGWIANNSRVSSRISLLWRSYVATAALDFEKKYVCGTGLRKILEHLCGSHFYEGCTSQTEHSTSSIHGSHFYLGSLRGSHFLSSSYFPDAALHFEKYGMQLGRDRIKFKGVSADPIFMRIVRRRRNTHLQKKRCIRD